MREGVASGPGTRRLGELVIGRLAAHGEANYQFRAGEDSSYYVRLLTSQGEKVLWGKDLARAVREGETQPRTGDLVGARRIAREAVTLVSRQRDTDGRIVRLDEQHAHRTRWVVEKVTFFAERSRLARQVREDHVDVRETVLAHPELKSTFLSVRAAEEFASQRIQNPQDREKFLQFVKGALAGSIQKGEPLPDVNPAPAVGQDESQAGRASAMNASAQMATPVAAITEVLKDRTTSKWLKTSLESALARDPVDALNDALLLASVLEMQLRSVFEIDGRDA